MLVREVKVQPLIRASQSTELALFLFLSFQDEGVYI